MIQSSPLGDLNSIQVARKSNVNQQQIRMDFLQPVERIGSVAGDSHDVVVKPLQKPAEMVAGDLLVFDNENPRIVHRRSLRSAIPEHLRLRCLPRHPPSLCTRRAGIRRELWRGRRSPPPQPREQALGYPLVVLPKDLE